MRIGVFDSGIGGVIVLKELIKQHPNHEYIYYGDSANVPYGNKSANYLIELSDNIINFFIKKEVDVIILACGTISSILNKEDYKIPIIDVITETVNYLENKSYNKIGLIATTITVDSGLFTSKLTSINKDVIPKSCPKFVDYIENNLLDTKEFVNELKKELKVFIDNPRDVLILGCTHYPLLKSYINDYLKVELIDMGVVLAKNIKLKPSNNHCVEIYFSKKTKTIVRNVQKILGVTYDIIEKKI